MSEEICDNVNQLPFKLRFTSTQKMTKELVKMIADRRQVLERLYDEYELIGRHKNVLANIKQRLETCHDSLKQVRSLCQCQSDDDRTAGDKQLATNEEALTKLKEKIDKIQLIKCIDVEVKRLPSNWRATLIRIQRQRAQQKQSEDNDGETGGEPKDSTGDGINNDEVICDENRANESKSLDSIGGSTDDEISHQFEKDLERKIYETQIEELLQLIQQLVMKTKTMRARIDISKQLIKAVLKLKRELESNNSVLKESVATCHCAEAGPPEDQEFQNRLQEKRRLEEEVERVSIELKHWEEEYSLLKESQHKNKENEKSEANKTEVIHQPVQQPMTTTVVEVSNEEEEVVHDYSTVSQMANTQSCMFAGHGGMTSQGTANPAVIYLEGLVAAQQPTYIAGHHVSAHPSVHPTVASQLLQPQLGVYPHAYALGGHPHHSYAHQAPDGSIQVYSSDSAGHPTHPSYIAYQ